MTYEELLSKVPHSLREKMEHSAELLRKAEKLALAYDPQDGYYLAFSGGKDSQALYHMAQLVEVKFKAHMNFTSVDPPEVIRFVRHQYPDVHTIPPKDSIYNIAIQRGILPSMTIRWCCSEFKERAGAGKVTLIGIRRQESTRRAKRNEVEIDSHKFSGTLEGLDEYREQKLAKKRKKKTEGINITNATEERTLGCISGKESLLISPLLYWTEDDVWTFLNALGVPHCSLYDEGWHRIGCINCPMASRSQKLRENERWPHVKRKWLETIMAIRRGGGYRKPFILPQRKDRPCQIPDMGSSVRENGGERMAQKNEQRPMGVFGRGFIGRLRRSPRKRDSREHIRLVDFR